jgi:hypothetical protein
MKVTTVERMVWTDPVIADVPVPAGKLTLRSGFGSGLGRRPSDPADTFWAIGDRRSGTQPEGCCRHQALRNVRYWVDDVGMTNSYGRHSK